MKIIDIEQGSPEWKEMRRTKIGGSDAAAIMSVSPWLSTYQLWEQKVMCKETSENDAMSRGKRLESKARDLYNKINNSNFQPCVVVDGLKTWMMASLDGAVIVNARGRNYVKYALEIKAPGRTDHEIALSGNIPDKYYPQLQHIMYVCELDQMDYFSFDGENGVTVKCYRDDSYIDKLIEKEHEFYQRIINLDPPPLTEKDYSKKSGIEWEMAIKDFVTAKEAIKYWEEQQKQAKDWIIELADGQNCIGGGVRVQRVVSKGRVDFSIVKELEGVDLEPYRKPRLETWKITEV